ncbi:uncharacterized protein LOC106073087 [Biomphalaria glabrata]|uniref:Uncharacterized protein LOC106073087 n=1 Tax=Biomphalaria glabrata TaxID=6526 RepID=A0A9U8EJ75_BIOGL|nr:uncharacterized protein LOC106073087 [Biomphalaria glabrata]
MDNNHLATTVSVDNDGLKDAISAANFSIGAIRLPYRCILQLATAEELMLFKILSCCVNPLISVLGFIANMVSIAILRRSGMSKPSNILLLGLVLADSMNQLLTVNYGDILAQLGPNKRYPQLCGWQYGAGLNFFLMIFRNVFFFLGNLGQYVCTVFPVLITIERLLAVFMPITFTKIVTPKTAVICVVLAFFFWFPWILFYMIYNDVYFIEFPEGDNSMYFAISARLLPIMDTFVLLNYYVFDSLESWVPIIFVTGGCVLVWIKVKVSLSKRRKLMPSQKQSIRWSPRTTRTLLITCFVFSVTHIIYSFINYNITAASGSQYRIYVEAMNLLYLINSSSNFFIYIASNRKLLKIFLDILHRRK